MLRLQGRARELGRGALVGLASAALALLLARLDYYSLVAIFVGVLGHGLLDALGLAPEGAALLAARAVQFLVYAWCALRLTALSRRLASERTQRRAGLGLALILLLHGAMMLSAGSSGEGSYGSPELVLIGLAGAAASALLLAAQAWHRARRRSYPASGPISPLLAIWLLSCAFPMPLEGL